MALPAPVVSRSALHDAALQFQLDLSQCPAAFAGHFPDAPILPGVLQLAWAVDLAREHLGASGPFPQMQGLKFMKVLTPRDRPQLELAYDAASSELRFRYFSADTVFSSGKLRGGDAA